MAQALCGLQRCGEGRAAASPALSAGPRAFQPASGLLLSPCICPNPCLQVQCSCCEAFVPAFSGAPHAAQAAEDNSRAQCGRCAGGRRDLLPSWAEIYALLFLHCGIRLNWPAGPWVMRPCLTIDPRRGCCLRRLWSPAWSCRLQQELELLLRQPPTLHLRPLLRQLAPL